MTMKMLIPVGTVYLLAGLAGCERDVSYTADVQPIFDSYCVQCHTATGEGEAASGFVVDNQQGGPRIVRAIAMAVMA